MIRTLAVFLTICLAVELIAMGLDGVTTAHLIQFSVIVLAIYIHSQYAVLSLLAAKTADELSALRKQP